MKTWGQIFLLLFVSTLLTASTSLAQGSSGHGPSGHGPGGHTHSQPMATMPEAADPDTVVARLILPDGVVLPAGISFQPDTVTIGQMAWLALEVPANEDPGGWQSTLSGLDISVDWLHLDPNNPTEINTDGQVRLPVRVLQINPFRVEVGEHQTEVVLVDLVTSGVQETAGVRDPRHWGWNTWTLVLVALLITVVALLAYWAWTARKVVNEDLTHWEIPPPAWLAASSDLAELLSERLLDRGESRLYQDRLTHIARRYVAGRFRIKAVEMTPSEISRAGVLRGYAADQLEPFAQLLTSWDGARFDPSAASASGARSWARDFFSAMAKVRVIPRHTPVSAGLLLAAEKSWAALEAELLANNSSGQADNYAPEKMGGI